MLVAIALSAAVRAQRCSAQTIQVVDTEDQITRYDAINNVSVTEELGVPPQPAIPGNGPYFTSGKPTPLGPPFPRP
jgi:hypothetical protein